MRSLDAGKCRQNRSGSGESEVEFLIIFSAHGDSVNLSGGKIDAEKKGRYQNGR